MTTLSIYEKSKGALLATAIGDALGWPNELNSGSKSREETNGKCFHEWSRRNRVPFWHSETILPGEYSDDTQLTLAVGRSLLNSNWIEQLAFREFPYWLNYERGAGRTLIRSSQLLKKRIMPWKTDQFIKDYYQAGGNGGVMRILPHVIYKHKESMETIIDDVIEDVLITHGHPRAILGATCYAVALHYLFNKNDVLHFAELPKLLIEKKSIWGKLPAEAKFKNWLDTAYNKAGYNYTNEWNDCYRQMLDTLTFIEQSLEDGLLTEDKSVLERIGAYSNSSGSGTVTILSAVYLFSKYVSSPELGILIPAYSRGIDTDTIASITGGLIGALIGSDWIPPEWKCVQDCDYIKSLALSLSRKNCEIAKHYDATLPVIDTDIGGMQFLDETNLSFKYSTINISRYRLLYGQTIYIKRNINKQLNTDINDTVSESNQGTLDLKIQISYSELKQIINNDSFEGILLKEVIAVVLLYVQGNDIDLIEKKVHINKKAINSIVQYWNKKKC